MATAAGVTVFDESHTIDDVAGAERLLAALSADAVLLESAEPFLLRHRTVGDDRLRLSTIQVASAVHVRVAVDGAVGVAHRRRGELRARSNGRDLDTGAPFLVQPGLAETWSTGLEARLIGLDLPVLGEFVGRRLAPRGRVLGQDAALSPALQRHWELTVEHVEAVLGDAELLHNDLIRQAAVDTVFAAAVSVFGIGSDAAGHDAAAPAAVRRAVQYIDDHLGDPIGVVDIAAAARLSVRGLQSAFRRSLGVTPAGYVRTARLAAVRADLTNASADTSTVAAVARRWGFTHLPRFAQHYRETYGEQPSETLRA
ncbi:helix-turn-helix domain-containing protein [Microbacterium sp. 179-B 1A2 NHS]|uniref:helix-turn-helix domain-containing protein n=1 Tax=Microbacterium sp. 179-B 1A2 NHS TaxID=3142383 RepID=UPI0039A018C5